MEETKEKEPKKENKLLDWFKFIAGVLFILLIFYKLAVSNIVFDFSKFDFNS